MSSLKIWSQQTSTRLQNKLALFLSFVLIAGVLLLFIGSNWRSLSAQTLNCSNQYVIDEQLPTGARWQMCWEQRLREGVVLYDVYYTPLHGIPRKVLGEAHLAQIHVPYDDNGARYHDSTDSGLGGSYLSTLSEADCPTGELRSTATASVLCLQTLPRGYAFKYTTSGVDTMLQGYLLSLFSISHVGEYNYIVQWQFTDDGAILPSVAATGKLQRLGTYVSELNGWPLGNSPSGVIRGVGHTHNYYWKLDFDIGDAENDLVEEFNFPPANNNQERVLEVTPLITETARSSDPFLQRFWRIRDKNITNSDGHAISYEIEPLRTGNRYIGPPNEPFTYHDFYVTRQKDCEIFASHNSAPCGENLADYVDGEDTDGQDLVVWFGISFHHLPRDEDETYMPAHWDGFVIAPRDWTSSNPLDSEAVSTFVPTPTPTPSATATATPIPNTPTSTASATATATETVLDTPTATPTPSATSTSGSGPNGLSSPTTENTATSTQTATASSTATHTPKTPTPTQTDMPTVTNTPTATKTAKPTLTPTYTAQPTQATTATSTATPLPQSLYLPLISR